MNKNKTLCLVIIQARIDSSRFPRKVLAKIEGRPMLWHVINRAKKIEDSRIVVATTKRKIDNKIVRIARNCGVEYFRGKTDDVLDRFYDAAKCFDGKVIMRITGDCPLLDPKESSKVLRKFYHGRFDYVTNGEGTFPDGLDTECFSFDTLRKTWQNARLKSERQHVTAFIKNNPKMFKIFSYKSKRNLSNHRWTVDEKEDLKFVRKIYAKMRPRKIFFMQDILNILMRQPELMKINYDIGRNEGYFLSLKRERAMKRK